MRFCYTQIYGLLSVHKEQLAPERVVLAIDESGMFSITDVHCLADDTLDRPAHWIANMHTTVADDITFIQKNPLCNNACDDKGTCPDRHWACPYVLASLFGGSHVARRTNRHIYLITPGIFLNVLSVMPVCLCIYMSMYLPLYCDIFMILYSF